MKGISERQERIKEKLDSETSLKNWTDWHWQIEHSITSLDMVEKILGITFGKAERRDLEKTLGEFPLSVTPYYLSLIDASDYKNDPIFKQSIPSPMEIRHEQYDMSDPLAEDRDSPVDCITHRYPDRVLFIISNTCSMYCRHCTRKRRVGDVDSIPSKRQVDEGISYIKKHSEIRDVLLSGGDPLMLSDDYLDYILTELRKIPHVEVIRLGTRMPVVLPFRITDELAQMLAGHQPLWINTHFNHPREISSSAKKAIRKLADAGIPLGNQSVLLAGVNDCPRIIKALVQKLVKNRVRPYYLYQCDLSKGLSHFRTPVGKGIEIIENLIGHTSGFAIPRYVIDAPEGGGKIPVMPSYLISRGTNKVVLRNYEGVITTYKEPDAYEPIFCDRNCGECDYQLKLDEPQEGQAVGISRLISDHDDSISLTPVDSRRIVMGEEDEDD